MSSRARRLVRAPHVERFDWATDSGVPQGTGQSYTECETRTAESPLRSVREPEIDLAALEREVFTKGYAQGERAGAEAAAARGDAMVRRLAQTLEELGTLRAGLMHKSERELVRLAVAIATRVIHREISLDRELLLAMARVAVDRLGDVTSATIYLHPEDFAATASARGGAFSTGMVRVMADPAVHRGGCLVESNFGQIDLGIGAQVDEIANALLGDDDDMMACHDAQVRLAS
jgi:flagellar assembly protein FliH